MNYDTSVVNYQSIATILIAVLYLIILVPFFFILLSALQDEVNKQILYSHTMKNQFKRMFDSLQEGIIVLNDGEIEFMNDLSNKFMNFLSKTLYD